MREAKERRRDEQGEEARDGGGDEGRRERSDDDYSFLLEDIYLGPRSVSSLPDAWVRAGHTMKRNPDGPLYLETAVSTLRETSHLTSAPSSDCPTKIVASNTTVFLKNEPVKK